MIAFATFALTVAALGCFGVAARDLYHLPARRRYHQRYETIDGFREQLRDAIRGWQADASDVGLHQATTILRRVYETK